MKHSSSGKMVNRRKRMKDVSLCKICIKIMSRRLSIFTVLFYGSQEGPDSSESNTDEQPWKKE